MQTHFCSRKLRKGASINVLGSSPSREPNRHRLLAVSSRRPVRNPGRALRPHGKSAVRAAKLAQRLAREAA